MRRVLRDPSRVVFALLVVGSMACGGFRGSRSAADSLAAGDRAFFAGDYVTAESLYQAIDPGDLDTTQEPRTAEARRCAAKRMLELAAAQPRCSDWDSCKASAEAALFPAECKYLVLGPEHRAVIQAGEARVASALLDHLKSSDASVDPVAALKVVSQHLLLLADRTPTRAVEWIEVLERQDARLDEPAFQAQRTLTREWIAGQEGKCRSLREATKAACTVFFASRRDRAWRSIEVQIAAGQFGEAFREIANQRQKAKLAPGADTALVDTRRHAERIAALLEDKANATRLAGAKLAYRRLAALARGYSARSVAVPDELTRLTFVKTRIELDATCSGAPLGVAATSVSEADAELIIRISECSDRLARDVRARTVNEPGTRSAPEKVVTCPYGHNTNGMGLNSGTSYQCIVTSRPGQWSPGRTYTVYDVVQTRSARARVAIELPGLSPERRAVFEPYLGRGRLVTGEVTKTETRQTPNSANSVANLPARAAFAKIAEQVTSIESRARSRVRGTRALDLRSASSLELEEILHRVMVNDVLEIPGGAMELERLLGFDKASAQQLVTTETRLKHRGLQGFLEHGP